MLCLQPFAACLPVSKRVVDRAGLLVGMCCCVVVVDIHTQESLAPYLSDPPPGGVVMNDAAVPQTLGDAILWTATTQLVAQFHQPLRTTCALYRYQDAEIGRRHVPVCNLTEMVGALQPGGVVLLSAGGNWGDKPWMAQQARLNYMRAALDMGNIAGTKLQVNSSHSIASRPLYACVASGIPWWWPATTTATGYCSG